MTERQKLLREWATLWLDRKPHIDVVAQATGLTQLESMVFMMWLHVENSLRDEDKGEEWK